MRIRVNMLGYLKLLAVLVSFSCTFVWLAYMTAVKRTQSSKDISDYQDPWKHELQPKQVIGHPSPDVKFVFGVPHIHRSGENYILPTLTSLLYNVPDSHRHLVCFVVLIADQDANYTTNLITVLRMKFDMFIRQSMLLIITPNVEFYPDFQTIPYNYFFQKGKRAKFEWTAKQNYDYAYLMLYCQNMGKYYIQMEDDIQTHENYIQLMDQYLTNSDLPAHWFVIDLSTLGFIGKMFHSQDIVLVANFLLTFHAYKPVDWLLGCILPVVACSPNEQRLTCNEKISKIRFSHSPSLFQHIGMHSSLKGKLQLLKDKDFWYFPRNIERLIAP